MNTHVDFETAKLLKEKGWNTRTLNFYFEDGESKENTLKETTGMDYGSEFTVEFSELVENWNDKWLTKKSGDRCFGCSKSKGYFKTYSAPTIAEVVMWFYEKHDIWIETPFWDSKFRIKIIDTKGEKVIRGVDFDNYNSPTEAYQEGITYTLKNLLK